MSNHLVILLLQDARRDVESIRRALDRAAVPFTLTAVEHVPTALARLRGGGVDVVLLDLSLSEASESLALARLRDVRSEAPDVPIIALCSLATEGLALKAMKEGATQCVIREWCASDLGDLVRPILERRSIAPASPSLATSEKAGTVITFMGVKGGVGTTTAALNTAFSLARDRQVVLVELPPGLSTLSVYLRPPARARTIAHLLELEPAEIDMRQAEACLWSSESTPQLRILSAPQNAEQCREISPAHARAILATLAKLADYVVVDMQGSLGETHRVVIGDSSRLALVVSRDRLCVELTKRLLPCLKAWNSALVPGTVIVNRVALAAPMPIPEFETRTGLPTLRVIPPDPDLCLSAQNAGRPVADVDPRSLVASSFAALAECLASSPGRQRRTVDGIQTAEPEEGANTTSKILTHASKDLPMAMVSQYLQRCRSDLTSLKAALARHEYESARVLGHQMKGCGGAYGFPELTEAGDLIERAATKHSIGELQTQVDSLEARLSQIAGN
jgi:pilus assembly protein CpaE